MHLPIFIELPGLCTELTEPCRESTVVLPVLTGLSEVRQVINPVFDEGKVPCIEQVGLLLGGPASQQIIPLLEEDIASVTRQVEGALEAHQQNCPVVLGRRGLQLVHNCLVQNPAITLHKVAREVHDSIELVIAYTVRFKLFHSFNQA